MGKEIYKKYMLICANGCGQAFVDTKVFYNSESIKDGDYSLYCRGCGHDLWFAIPKKKEEIK